jgi:diguanylate cyclase (GGDEF)-like protein/PAS domain S-box-containing protein
MTRESNRLLIVDDEELNRDMLSRRLERSGFAVDVAEDGESALQILRKGEVDLVLLDSMMPGLTGVDVLKLLRATQSPEQLPVIMVTALNDSSKIVEALNLGANDYVTKPVNYPVALARIRSQLARKTAEESLRKSEERYALAARGSNDGLWDWDLRAKRIYYSSRWKDILGYGEEEIGQSEEEWFLRVHPDDRGLLRSLLESHWTSGGSETFESEHRILHRSGMYRWVRCRGAAVLNEAGTPQRMAGSLADITPSKAFDALTGLPNLLQFQDSLEQVFGRYKQDPTALFAALFLDLDRFQLINDSMGHGAGDDLLRAVAERLSRSVRSDSTSVRPVPRDLVARLGGDEFAVLLTGISGEEEAVGIARRVIEAFSEPFRIGDKVAYCTVSIGIAPCAPRYREISEVLRDADTAMYSAKSGGRSRCEVFDEAMRQRVLHRVEMENELRQAIKEGNISVFYQAKVRLSDETVGGFEALARWNHPVHGFIPPSEFIPVAEETGLIHELGMLVLREACRQMKKWQMEYPCTPPLEVSVNLSPLQFRQPDLVEEVAAVLKETGLDPACLQLEVTESLVVDNRATTTSALHQLKELKVGLKIDDFGTGYSSLSRLSQLPFDSLKIDRSFTVQLGGPQCNVEIVSTILTMARSLGMDVVAEGVEQREQANMLKSMGCEFAQGYYFARPVSSQDAEQMVAAASRRLAPTVAV